MKQFLRYAGKFSLETGLLLAPFFCFAQTNTAISIIAPTNNQTFIIPTNVQIVASITNIGGPTNVEFLVNNNALGAGTITTNLSGSVLATFTWTNPAPGYPTLTAIVTNSGGVSVTSPPVKVIVEQAENSNAYTPLIVTPTNGQIFNAPVNITIGAEITTQDINAPSNVVVFANSNNLGRIVLTVFSGFGAYGSVTWTNPPPGAYAFTAAGTNVAGAVISSAPVNVIVQSKLTLQPPSHGNIVLQTYGSPGKNFDFFATTNLQTWQDIGTSIADTNGSVQFMDTNASNFAWRFYQSVPH